ncbi:MAG: hypothetical protein KatS3mg044_0675 [Rhodothermaceae bacterium]|nr:MAG: hypothetical protein KatS3mg044_0675 [Rhodothermaceae bacterium]
MPFSFGLDPWWLVLCLLGAAGLTYWTYRTTVPALPVGRRLVLGGLRFVALAILLFLLFEPVLRRLATREQPPVLAVLLDTSQSLRLAQPDSTATPRLIRDVIQRLPTDRVPGEIRFFTFDGDTRPLDDLPRDSLRFDGQRTNISQALAFVRETLDGEHLQGVLLVSDGQYNTGRNPVYVAERYPVPIYTVALGDTTRRRDVQIRRVTTNDIAYAGVTLPLQVGLQVKDFPGERVVVSLFKDGQRLQSVPVTLPEGTAEVPVDLEYTPEGEGLHRLQVTVTHLPGEVTYRNNRETVTIQVLKNRRRLLLLAAPPNPDLAALRQLLDADERLEVAAFVQKAPGQFYEGNLPARLDDVDLIVLAGYPGPGADPVVLQRVAEAAEAGTPLLFLYHGRTDLRLLQTYLGAYLPATPRVIRRGLVEAVPVPTPEGRRHPVLMLPSVSAERMRRLPPLRYSETRWDVSPDARVLLTTEVRGVALNDPLLLLRRRGRARSAALLGDGTWRWKNLPESLDDLTPVWPGLVDHLIQWVAAREDDRQVRVQPVENIFGGDEPVQLTGQVYDESLNPIDDAAVSVEITAPDGTRFPHSMNALGNGRYLLDLGAMPEGTYRYTATATRDGATLGTDEGSFAVGALALEFKETSANVALLRQIAARSGGRFFLPDDLPALPDSLVASGLFTPLRIEEATEIRLWQRYPFMILVVLLLTTEWFLRKRSGMV